MFSFADSASIFWSRATTSASGFASACCCCGGCSGSGLGSAAGWAEVLQANDIFIGVNAVDYSGYPDCRPAFIEAFEKTANLATKAGVEGQQLSIHTPLMKQTKAEIIQQGHVLGLDYSMSVSCYQANDNGEACGVCDSCRLRKQGFEQVVLCFDELLDT